MRGLRGFVAAVEFPGYTATSIGRRLGVEFGRSAGGRRARAERATVGWQGWNREGRELRL